MDYNKIYNNIVDNSRSENRNKVKGGEYYEKHHISPKCLGGKNSKDNLVLLTAREHFICHKLLVEIFPKNNKIFFAYFMMFSVNKFQKRDYKIGSHEYERLSILNGNYISKINLGKPKSEKTKKRMSRAGKNRSEEHKKNLSLSQLNLPDLTCPHCGLTGGHIAMKIWHLKNCLENPKNNKEELIKNRKHSEESCKKNSDSQKRIPKSICPHCKFEGKGTAMKRYHFDNCIKNPDFEKSKLIKCPYCDTISVDIWMMKKWHFHNCKQNPEYIDTRKIFKCQYCGIESKNRANMNRYHFENCKNK